MKRREPRVGRYLIYGLQYPRDCCLRYIGKMHKRREIRLAEHVQDAIEGGNRPLHHWIREIIDLGIHPEVQKPITISGKLGDDAKHYQARAVRMALKELEK